VYTVLFGQDTAVGEAELELELEDDELWPEVDVVVETGGVYGANEICTAVGLKTWVKLYAPPALAAPTPQLMLPALALV
jgi:hypothetical protein